MSARRFSRRTGLTLIEAVIAASLFAFVVAKVVLVMRTAADYSKETSSSMVLEDAAQQVLDRIVYALMGSDRESLLPTNEAPLDSDEVTYRVSFGMEKGEVVWGEPERIALEDERSIVWRQDADSADERRVVWTNLVRPLLEGELPNGADDNGNGLVDESGLSFVVEGKTVTMRLTLAAGDGSAATVVRSLEATVACRNFLETNDGLDIRYR